MRHFLGICDVTKSGIAITIKTSIICYLSVFKDAVVNFFNSPAWREMLDTIYHLYEYTKLHGFANLYREFINALDPEGESNAYKVRIFLLKIRFQRYTS